MLGQSGFAAARMTHQADELSALDIKRDVLQGESLQGSSLVIDVKKVFYRESHRA
jgi:hypothetical protein